MLVSENTDKKVKHGLRYHPLYSVWRNMISRCYNKNVPSYKRYGGNEVKVCDEWLNNFKTFYDWSILNGWKKGLELDKDIKGNGKLYSPNTCIFVTTKVNSNNKKNSRNFTINGHTKSISEWADYYGTTYRKIQSRLWNGFSFEESINRAINNIDKNKKVLCVSSGIQYESVKDAANKLGIKETLIARVARGERNHTNGLYFKYIN